MANKNLKTKFAGLIYAKAKGLQITTFCKDCHAINIGTAPWWSILAALKRKEK